MNQVTNKLTISISDDHEVLEEIKVTIVSPKSIRGSAGTNNLKCEVTTWTKEQEIEGEHFTSLISCVPTCSTPKALKNTSMSDKIKHKQQQQASKLPTINEDESAIIDDTDSESESDDDQLDTFVISAFTPVNKITSQFFLGSVLAYKHPELLRHLQIRHIIALRHNNAQEAQQVCNKLSISLWNFDTRHANFRTSFKDTIRQIEDILKLIPSGERVFFHCRSGQHRSVCIVVALMMKRMNLTLEDAFGHIQHHRPCAELQYIPVLNPDGSFDLK